LFYYLIFLSLFWLFAGLEHFGQKKIWPVSFVLFVLVAGLRFETGWDWITYESYFNGLDYLVNKEGSTLKMELGFNLLIFMVKGLGGGFQGFLFVVSLLTSVFLTTFFFKTVGSRIAFCLAVFYSFLYLALNMTMMRQALSCAIECASIFFLMRQQVFYAVFFWILACLIHTSSIVFGGVFLYVMMRCPSFMIIKIYIICSVVGVFSFLFEFGFFSFLLSLFENVKLGFITDKISIYLSQDLHGSPSLGGLFYLFLNVAFGIYHQIRFFSNSYYFRVETFFLLLTCIAMGFFLDFAILWSRLQFLSVVIVCVALSRVMEDDQTQKKAMIFVLSLVVSVAVHVYQLGRPKMDVFFPYYSIVHVMLGVDLPDGRARYNNLLE
jgi:hypothetical protein